MLNRLFKLDEHHTDIKTEVIAGITSFLAMAYIIFVNPQILAITGMDANAVFMATCLGAAIGTLIMAFVANYPVGLAPGMGLNAFFAFTVAAPLAAGGLGFTWEEALGAVFMSGVVFLILTVTGIRHWIIDGVPRSLQASVGAGVGLFIAFIGLQTSGIVVENPATLISMGDLTSYAPLYTILGFFIIVTLDYFRIKGAMLIGVLAIAILSALLGHNEIHAVIEAPPSIEPTFFKLSFEKILHGSFLTVLITFVLVELFDATGTLMGITNQANLLDHTSDASKKRFSKALFSDSSAIVAGSFLGTSSVTAYLESVTGVQSGGRTGLTALVIALLFIGAIFFAPLAASIPPYATAPALIYLAGLMLKSLKDVMWDDVTEAIPATLLVLGMPLTYSIATGFSFGFISFVILKVCTGRYKEVHPAIAIVAILFFIRYAFFAG